MNKPAKLCAAGTKLRSQINRRYPNRDKASDGWLGDPRHQAAGNKSDHNPDRNGVVRAIDVDADLAPGVSSWELAEAIRACALAGDRRLSYIIHKGKICSATVRNWAWRRYSGDNAHDKHLHVSFSTDGDADGRGFDIQFPAAKRK